MSKPLTPEDDIPPASPPPILLPAQAVARQLSVSLRTLWRLRSAGRLPPPIRIGGTVRWRVTDIDAWIAAGCPELPSQGQSAPNPRFRQGL